MAKLPARTFLHTLSKVTRRQFLRGLLTVPGLFLVQCMPSRMTSARQTDRSIATSAAPANILGKTPGKPAFSWDRVPVAAHCSNRSGDFTPEQIRFLTERFPLITIEKAQGGDQYPAFEDGMYQAARQLKAASPDITVLFYWNAFVAYPKYRAYQTFAAHPEWKLREADGSDLLVQRRFETYDLSQPALRAWWVGVAQAALAQAPFDGVFMDAVSQAVAPYQRTALGSQRALALQNGMHALLAEARTRLRADTILVYNGLRGDATELATDPNTSLFLNQTSGVMLEHFNLLLEHDSNGKLDKEDMANHIALIQEAGAQGKVVLVKGWPEFGTTLAAVDPPANPVTAARHALTFPLACFLIAAEPYSYFIYTWGYHENNGTFEWYPEFDKPLGNPQGQATRNGWVYRRSFEHADVQVDLEYEQANIDWKD